MDKGELRARMQGQGLIDRDLSEQVVAVLRRWMSSRLPGTVAAFLAMTDEVDVAPLFEMLPGWRWVLPRVELDRTVTFRDRDVPRELHELGMRQPTDTGRVIPLHEIDLFLVPGVAFDESGGRLGRGAGHYDRVLSARRRDSAVVGVTVRSRVVERVPSEGHDQRVDYVATETGVIECSPNH